MAGKASKKQVQANTKILADLYKVSVPIVVLAFARAIYSKDVDNGYLKTVSKFLLLNLPLLGSLYTIEISGRPKVVVDEFGKKKIVKEGLDLSQSDGLLQYLFDLIYLSLFADIGKIIFNTNKLWYVLILCPIYVGFKLYGLKQQFFGKKSNDTKPAKVERSSSTEKTETKSKRQLKREKNGDNQVKFKYR